MIKFYLKTQRENYNQIDFMGINMAKNNISLDEALEKAVEDLLKDEKKAMKWEYLREEEFEGAIKKSGGGDHVACVGCGIVERLCNCAKRSSSLEELLTGAYNSRYTDARINRVILFSMIGVSDIFEKLKEKDIETVFITQNTMNFCL